MTEKAQYDVIGQRYARMKENAAFCVADSHTLLDALRACGDLRGKPALDVACGHGDIARLLAGRGASPVIGVDVSAEMVRLARALEHREPRGIRYLVADAAELPVLGRFAVATASYLFNYAPTRAVKRAMFAAIRANLAPDGTLLAIVPNTGPFLEEAHGAAGARLVERVPGGEAPLMRMEFLSDPPVPFAYYEWQRADYEQAAREAGFGNVRWQSTRTPPPDERWNAAFWEDYQRAPRSSLLICR
ncbi:class I SAM-dependent methyltransferase [Streptomyces caatingaensis]|uniref:class I SAM-dependent methyltransferase n=1 Tax=Streptomyces caatingaensis TaxID=1678637 RepID=UPI000A7AE62D|nr:class I SAM-dependent methyltransferase [Streptomyces caatingaensis]